MRSFARLALAAFAVAVVATTSQAAILNFSGLMNGTTQAPFLQNGTFSLSVTYNETGATNGNATASTFSAQRVGGGMLDYTMLGLAPVSLTFGKNGANDTLTIAGSYGVVTTGQPSFGQLTVTFERAEQTGATLALNSTNIATMLSNPTVYEGRFSQTNNLVTPIATAEFFGTIPVPEPGSIGLLAGLGLVCGRRVWRRRQQKQAAAAV